MRPLLLSLCCILMVNKALCFREFNTLPPPVMSRRTSHNPVVMSKTCYLIPDEGPCRGSIPMYYFDSNVKNCSIFYWGGCQGNGNRFDSEEECTKTCLSPPNWEEGRPEYCRLTWDYGFCFGAVTKYYYDPLWKVCKKALYSGCGGNRNNFNMFEQCEQVCRFGKPYLMNRTPKVWKDGIKKVIIVNPWNASTKRSGGIESKFITANETGAAPGGAPGPGGVPGAPGAVPGVQGVPGAPAQGVTPPYQYTAQSAMMSDGNTNVMVLRHGQQPKVWLGKK